MTVEQVLEKSRRWSQLIGYLRGERRLYDVDLRWVQDLYGIRRFLSRDEMLAFDHLPEMRRVIEEFYQPGMLGGAIYTEHLALVRGFYWPTVFASKAARRVLDRVAPVPSILEGAKEG